MEEFELINDTDLVCGTKMRGIKFFESLDAKEIVTAASSSGYGQVAVAYCCQQVGLPCTIYVAGRSEFTELARSFGARMMCCPSNTKITELERKARLQRGAYFLKYGLADDGYIAALAENMATSYDLNSRRIWVVAGSCTIALALRKAFPDAHLNLVRVGLQIWPDLQDKLNREKITIYEAPERFYEPAREMPPYTSLATYDAKLWQFVVRYGRPGDVIWNVK